jgi:uncharacterized protein (TIGR03435 family)
MSSDKTNRQVGAVLLAMVLVLPAGSAAQGPSPGKATFEVASVRDSSSLEQDGLFSFKAGHFQVTNQSLRWIIRWAYDLRDYQVVGLPGWAERQRFEIRATYLPASADAATVRTMLQRLLAERFAMRSHREQHEIRLYQLVKANENGSLGPKLTASNVDCQTVAASPPAPSANGERPRPACVSFGGADQITGFTKTMADLTKALDEVVGSPVVDRTGLTGTWDYDLRWTLPAGPPAEPNQQTIESSAQVFTGLREQLGLKLEATRAPYDVLVVDAVSRPTSN